MITFLKNTTDNIGAVVSALFSKAIDGITKIVNKIKAMWWKDEKITKSKKIAPVNKISQLNTKNRNEVTKISKWINRYVTTGNIKQCINEIDASKNLEQKFLHNIIAGIPCNPLIGYKCVVVAKDEKITTASIIPNTILLQPDGNKVYAYFAVDSDKFKVVIPLNAVADGNQEQVNNSQNINISTSKNDLLPHINNTSRLVISDKNTINNITSLCTQALFASYLNKQKGVYDLLDKIILLVEKVFEVEGKIINCEHKDKYKKDTKNLTDELLMCQNNFHKKVKTIRENLKKNEKIINKTYNKKRNEIEAQVKFDEIDEKINKLQKNMRHNINDINSMTKQEKDFSDNVNKSMEKNMNKIKEMNEQLSNMNKEIKSNASNLNVGIDNVVNETKQLINETEELKKEKERQGKDIEKIENFVEQLKEANSDKEQDLVIPKKLANEMKSFLNSDSSASKIQNNELSLDKNVEKNSPLVNLSILNQSQVPPITPQDNKQINQI